MKSKSMITVVIMMLCITINAQEQSNKTLVAYFSATGTTEKLDLPPGGYSIIGA